MKKFLVAALGLVALGGAAPASAADLAAGPYSKAGPMIAAVYDWSGFYAGLNGGGGWSRNCWDLNTGFGGTFQAIDGCHKATGAVAGGQAGYRLQASSWVFGLEAQGNWANLKGSSTGLASTGTNNQSLIDSFGLFTGQFGYAWDRVLWYVKGGAAITQHRYRGYDSATGAFVDGAKETPRWGGAVGTGLEVAFAPNWSVAIEYDHMFMGTRTLDFYSAPNVFTREERIRQDVDVATARINYRWGGPVVAKY